MRRLFSFTLTEKNTLFIEGYIYDTLLKKSGHGLLAMRNPPSLMTTKWIDRNSEKIGFEALFNSKSCLQTSFNISKHRQLKDGEYFMFGSGTQFFYFKDTMRWRDIEGIDYLHSYFIDNHWGEDK